jgi:hypothetical protein
VSTWAVAFAAISLMRLPWASPAERRAPMVPGRFRATSIVFFISAATVIWPTPPGTGEIHAARPAAVSNSASVTSRPSSSRLIAPTVAIGGWFS